MVEAIKVIFPFSIYSSNDCCCFLLKDWISSKYKSTPLGAKKVSNWATISLISAVDAVVAFSWYKVEAENFESIHNHSAYAMVERTLT